MERLPAFKRKPTQADVARLASVSQAVVSYVLSASPLVTIPAPTRERVLAAAAELGYVPNSAARSLRTRKTMTIAGVIPDITNPFYPAFERGIQDVAEARGYDLATYNTDGLAAKEQKSLRFVREGRVDGLIMTPFHITPADLAPLLEVGVNAVMLSGDHETWSAHGIDSVSIANEQAAREAVTYLLDRGHHRVGMIAGVAGTPPREGRVRGYLRALNEHGIAREPLLIRSGDYTETGGMQGMRELLRLPATPTAVFCANDLLALGAMAALREAGVRVPDDLAVVGFDDIPAARFVTPALTTVAQFPEQLGRRAAAMLFDRLDGSVTGPGRAETAVHELIVRQSA